MKSIHVLAASITLAIVLATVTAGVSYAVGLEQAYIHALAPINAVSNFAGIALQKAAFSQADLLPIYGASEELLQANEFRAAEFFENYPTGFAPFECSHFGSGFITHAEAIAAVGSDIRGKKVVFSFTSSQFTGEPGQFIGQILDARAYAGLFSRLDANELAFSAQLSYETKQLAARRMLQYPETLKSDPLLKFALEQLVSDTWLSRVLYYLSYFLGKLQILILELQDHYETVTYIRSLKNLVPGVLRQPAVFDWNADIARARGEQMPHSNNNPYGFDNAAWERLARKFKPQDVPQGDRSFLTAVESSTEWTDLELLLKITKELGAEPLLLGRPVNGYYFHAVGVSDAALQVYYTKLDKLAKQYSVPVVDFRDLQYDAYFTVDPLSHTSREGWVYVDRALDAFYHQTAH